MQKNIWYKVNVPINDLKGPSDEPMTLKVSEALLRRLEAIATATERKRSSVARMLIVRGLRLYEYDGELLDVEIPLNGKRVKSAILTKSQDNRNTGTDG